MKTAINRVAEPIALTEQVLLRIKEMIYSSNINDNDFYRTFRHSKLLPPEILKTVFQQYYYYIRTFPQILAGTSHRVTNEVVRLRLARTVVSELGDGVGDPHFVLFERVLKSVGVELDDWNTASYIAEAAALVNGLKDLFLAKPVPYAIGAHYVIEEFGFPMIVALYEGFRRYPGWKHEDFTYFFLHLVVESEHVAWIEEALTNQLACDPDSAAQIEAGAAAVLQLLGNFWRGLDMICQSRATIRSGLNESIAGSVV